MTRQCQTTMENLASPLTVRTGIVLVAGLSLRGAIRKFHS